MNITENCHWYTAHEGEILYLWSTERYLKEIKNKISPEIYADIYTLCLNACSENRETVKRYFSKKNLTTLEDIAIKAVLWETAKNYTPHCGFNNVMAECLEKNDDRITEKIEEMCKEIVDEYRKKERMKKVENI